MIRPLLLLVLSPLDFILTFARFQILLPETSLNEEISIEIYDHDSIGDDDLAAVST